MRRWLRLIALASLPALSLAPLPASATDNAAKERINSMINTQFKACWSPPVPKSAAEAFVRVQFALDRKGELTSGPYVIDVPGFKPTPPAVEAAKRAVQRCLPITLPPEDYEYWRAVTVNFDARYLLEKPAAPASPH